MTRFRNTYHFVPVSRQQSEDDWRTDARRFQAHGPDNGDAHDRYAFSVGDDARWSGRIICRLTAQTPLVVGGEQSQRGNDGEDYAYVKPYRWRGRPAIPATTLKGMISSIAEAASGSALRVLNNRKPLGFRQPMGGALHALGMIVPGENAGELAIRPLTLPLLQHDAGRNGRLADNKRPWRSIFANYANLKVYIGSYPELLQQLREDAEKRLGRRLRRDELPEPANVTAENFARNLPITPQQDDPLGGINTHCYMRVSPGGPLSGFLANLPADLNGRWNREQTLFTVFAQKPSDGAQGEILTADEFLNRGSPPDFVRGIIRVLGTEGRQIPNNKKHELFIPYPEEIGDLVPSLPIPASVVKKFNALARQRAEDSDDNRDEPAGGAPIGTPRPPRQRVPYLPFNTDAAETADWAVPDKGPVVPRLRPGQVVYFDIAKGAQPCVTAVSFSAIWRDCPEDDHGHQGVHDFFRAIDPELVPYHDGREHLTPAERLFGFVSSTKKDERAARVKKIAYAGRVRFSIATLENDPGDDSVFLATEAEGCDQPDAEGVPHTRLKVLGSPKLPSPALYFKPHNGRREKPLELPDEPQGRKFYLHHRTDASAPEQQPWRTKLPKNDPAEIEQRKLKNAVRPIKPGTSFVFHLDFDNLTEREINLLAFSLRPTELFRHKLGMGKPVGLGTVRIDPVALLLIDRGKRYSEEDPFSLIRWHRKSISPAAAVPQCYQPDVQRAANDQTISLVDRAAEYKVWASEASRWRDAIHALLVLGETNHDEATVQYSEPVVAPLTDEQFASPNAGDREQDTYGWHASNTPRRPHEAPRHRLQPIGSSNEIPPLESLPAPGGNSPRRGGR